MAQVFEWLLSKSGKTDASKSLIQKWAEKALEMLEANEIYDAKLLTIAIPDDELLNTLNSKKVSI